MKGKLKILLVIYSRNRIYIDKETFRERWAERYDRRENFWRDWWVIMQFEPKTGYWS